MAIFLGRFLRQDALLNICIHAIACNLLRKGAVLTATSPCDKTDITIWTCEWGCDCSLGVFLYKMHV